MTHTDVPSKAIATGPLPTSISARIRPSVAIFVTEPSMALALHNDSPSQASADGTCGSEYRPMTSPEAGLTADTVCSRELATHRLSPSKASATGKSSTSNVPRLCPQPSGVEPHSETASFVRLLPKKLATHNELPSNSNARGSSPTGGLVGGAPRRLVLPMYRAAAALPP